MNVIGQISSKEYQVQSPSSNVSGYSKSGAHTILPKDVPLFVDTGGEQHQSVTLKSVHPGWDLETANATDMTHVTLPCADGFAFVKSPFISSGFHFKSSPRCMADI